MSLRAGLSAVVELEVREADTAPAVGSGDVPVLATPRLVALAEQATVQAVAEHLPAGQTTVGTEVALRHRRPSAVGAVITVTARLVDVDSARLRFEIAADQDGESIADGSVRRVVVDRDAFLARVPGPA